MSLELQLTQLILAAEQQDFKHFLYAHLNDDADIINYLTLVALAFTLELIRPVTFTLLWDKAAGLLAQEYLAVILFCPALITV